MCVCRCPGTQRPRAMNQGLGLHLWPPSFSKPDAVVQLRILGHSGKGAPEDKCQNWSHPPLKETGSFIRPTGLCSLDCHARTCTDLDWHNLVHNIWILSFLVFDKWCVTKHALFLYGRFWLEICPLLLLVAASLFSSLSCLRDFELHPMHNDCWQSQNPAFLLV